MARKRQGVTEAELAILRVLWACGQATIRHLTDALYPGGTASHYATVKKLLTRLERKGCVARDERSVAHVFWATVGRDDLLRGRLQAVADELCGGSRTPLVMNLLRAQQLTEQERQELHAFLDEFTRRR
jgi:BlaI family penicillinase repressor